MNRPPDIDGIPRLVPAGRTLYHAGDQATHAFYLHEGLVKLHADTWIGLHRGDHQQNTNRLIDLAGPTDVIGVHQNQHPHTAIAAVDTRVTIIPREHLTHPGNARAVIDHLARANARAEARLQQNDLPVPIRFLETLKDLAARFGDATRPDISFTLPLTISDLAELTNSSRGTITRLLADLQDRGVLEGRKGTYVLHTNAVETYITDLIFDA